MTVRIVAHAPCIDGYAASRLLGRALDGPIDYVDWNLRETTLPPMSNVEKLYFVDCCPSSAYLAALPMDCEVVVIDHHESNKDATANIPSIKFIFAKSQCATELVCQFIELPQPWYVKHISDKDLWVWKHTDSRAIMRTLSVPLDLSALDAATPEDIHEMILKGKMLMGTDEMIISSVVSLAQPIEVQLDGRWFRAVWVRLPQDFTEWALFSEIGERLAEPVSIALIVDKTNKVSCRSVKDSPISINCADFCKQLGGGGHAQAAGCYIPGAYANGLTGNLFRL